MGPVPISHNSLEGTQGDTHHCEIKFSKIEVRPGQEEVCMFLSPGYKWLRMHFRIQNMGGVVSNMGAEMLGRQKKD
jgi:hypothetical protein